MDLKAIEKPKTYAPHGDRSPLSHNITIETGCRPEQSHSSDFYIGTKIYAGEDHKVRSMYPGFTLRAKPALTDSGSFMAHPETLLPINDVNDPVQRFLSVVKFYLSGWHIKPP